jgi:hypothetical protein
MDDSIRNNPASDEITITIDLIIFKAKERLALDQA